MKKHIVAIIGIILALAFTACGNSAEVESTDSSKTVTKSLESPVDSEPAEPIDTWEYTSKYTFEKITWAEAYREYLLNALEDPESHLDLGARFGLFFIDANDVPELVVSPGSAHIEPGYIVSYCDGEIIESEYLGEYGCFAFGEKSGVVVDARSAWILTNGINGRVVKTYQLKNGVLSNPWECSEWECPVYENEICTGYVMEYNIADNEVTENEYIEAWKSHIPENLTATGHDYTDRNAEYHEWTMHELNSKTINAYFDSISANEADVGSVTDDGTFMITGTLKDDQYYVAFPDWGENQYAYMLHLDEPLAIYYENEFYFLTEIQVEQYYKTKELLGSHVTLQGTVKPARNRYHHSPFILEPNLY